VGLNSTSAAAARSTPESQLVMSHAIATVAKTIDERILALPGSRDRLIPAIQHAIGYFEREIAAIPGPIKISAQQQDDEPSPFALFPSAEDITTGLGRSIAVRNSISWFVENGHERVFAVMGTRQRPGSGSAGWTDHTFRSLAASEQDARECLCEAAFTSLANAFANRLKERQREWRHLHANGPSQIGDGTGTATPPTTPSNGPAPEQQAIFSRYLDPAGDALMAEDGLNALIEWLHLPEAQLRISPNNSQVAALPGNGGSVPLPLMSSIDRRHWLVCMTDFSLQEAVDAIAKTPAANRYILI
jgi:hypothetical protein